MKQPYLLGILQFCAGLGAMLGVIAGLITMAGSLAILHQSPWDVVLGLMPGIAMILGSLAALGLIEGFIALITATVDIRNKLYTPTAHSKE